MTDETKAPPTARNDEETTRLAANLYEHVRQLNHASVGPPSLTLPATAYTILGNLSAAVYGLDSSSSRSTAFSSENFKPTVSVTIAVKTWLSF